METSGYIQQVMPLQQDKLGSAKASLNEVTLRDRFAMAALQGLLASCLRPDIGKLAQNAYLHADAMLAARER